MRAWIKFYSKWPTYPQVYIDGKFVGGIDVVSELIEDGDFIEMVPEHCRAQSETEKFKYLLKSSPVVALIDSNQPATCQDEESKALLSTLEDNGIKFIAIK